MKITKDDILMGRDAQYPLTDRLTENLMRLLVAANALADAYHASTGEQLRINSGYRPGHYNTQAGGSKRSAHLECMAIDWADPTGEVDEWIQAHLPAVAAMGFTGIEHPKDTPGWAHTDMRQRYDAKGQPMQVFRVR
jgi:hypothetical protein